MPEFDTLDSSGFLFTEVAGEWRMLTADFGEGYEAGALVGHPDGVRNWTIKIDVLPDGTDQVPAIADNLDQTPLFLLTEDGGFVLTEEGGHFVLESGASSTRAIYLWRFFRKSKGLGNQPFWIEFDDQQDGVRKKFLASFVDNRLSYPVLCAKIYSAGLQLRQRRVIGVDSPVPV